ncbi:hypothetical protein WICPIJ_008473 [Wickerhamomyces pijperi]|uniref:Uncharacterized protein n=1 Tax=Wickerhamomyces pijperi TaxID=599730 RepID=A0A9P8PWX1_WICPI|nr:hypothetical protein WICPIJ_008473 [Wickerhamomyces pijperi]
MKALWKAAASKYPKGPPCWKNPDNTDLALLGAPSKEVAAATPNIPPMTIPKIARIPKNCSKVLTNPVPICKTARMAKLIIKGHLRPYLSAV